MKNKKVFSVKIDGKDVELCAIKPSVKVQHEASLIRAKAFAESLSAGAILRCQLDDCMRQRGMWDDTKQRELDKLNDRVDEGVLKLQRGGIKLSEAKKLALEVRELRSERAQLLSSRVSLDASTAEGQSENESLLYILSKSLVYNDSGDPYFKTYEDYLENRASEVARKGFSQYVELMSDLNENFENDLPENKFLHQYKFTDEKNRLINKDGKLVDLDDKLVDEKGRLINEQGELVDKNGVRVDEDGNYVVEFTPFLDDNDNPI